MKLQNYRGQSRYVIINISNKNPKKYINISYYNKDVLIFGWMVRVEGII